MLCDTIKSSQMFRDALRFTKLFREAIRHSEILRDTLTMSENFWDLLRLSVILWDTQTFWEALRRSQNLSDDFRHCEALCVMLSDALKPERSWTVLRSPKRSWAVLRVLRGPEGWVLLWFWHFFLVIQLWLWKSSWYGLLKALMGFPVGQMSMDC